MWAEKMIVLLKEINKATHDAGGRLETAESEHYRKRYRVLLFEAEQECPSPDETAKKIQGKTARSKARNLLERLRDYEKETLRFMVEANVPFSNNQAENDLRMTKVQQKISGCFRSMDGAKIFCRIRSYLSTCRKQGVTATQALRLLFQGQWPEFMNVKDQCAE
jgi:transposase